MAQGNGFTPDDKRIIIDALRGHMQVTARAARAAEDKGLKDVATAYHKTNANVMIVITKVDSNIPV